LNELCKYFCILIYFKKSGHAVDKLSKILQQSLSIGKNIGGRHYLLLILAKWPSIVEISKIVEKLFKEPTLVIFDLPSARSLGNGMNFYD